MRLRILIGTLALVAGLVIYGLAVASLAARLLPELGVMQLVFYAIAGMVWVWPAARLTRWMQRAAPHRPPPGA